MRSSTAVSILALAAFVLPPIGCGSQTSDASRIPARPPTPVRVERVSEREFAPSWVVPGIVEAEVRISLGFRVAGEISHFAAEEGDRVEMGDVIAVLELEGLERAVRTARAAVARAAARAEEAELVFSRQRRLIELASTSQQRFDTARSAREMGAADLDHARLELEAAEERLAFGTLRAPQAGYIERRLVDAHEHASEGTPVAVLTALDRVTVRSAVSDTALSLLLEGVRARVHSAAWPGRTFDGSVRHIALAADESTRTVPFEVALENPDLALRPEMVVDVELRAGSSRPLRAVPLAAVLRGLDSAPFSFIVVGEGAARRVERRVLELGPMDEDRVLVRAGVSTGDLVVVRGQHFVRAGDRVRIVEEGP